jgi:hypothetical protein
MFCPIVPTSGIFTFAITSAMNSEKSIREKSSRSNSAGVNPEQSGFFGLPHDLPI